MTQHKTIELLYHIKHNQRVNVLLDEFKDIFRINNLVVLLYFFNISYNSHRYNIKYIVQIYT